jgi:biotin synthase-related radical SAM superfamily protein
LIFHGIARYEDVCFDRKDCISDFGVDEEVSMRIVQTGEPFLTSGCPNCNRPYYNEKPSGPIYNYPKPLKKKETGQILQELVTG